VFMRSAKFAMPRPSAPSAVTVTAASSPVVSELIPYERLDGTAATLRFNDGPDGPLSGGASESFIVQAALIARMATAAARREWAEHMALLIPKVAEVDLDLAGHRDDVADAIEAPEGDAGERGQDGAARLELHERRLLLRRVPHELEAERQAAVG